MRWKAIFVLVPLLIIIFLTAYLMTDKILQWSIENSLETAVGAKVDARPVHLDYGKLVLTIGNLQIANPNNTWRNIIEGDNIRLQLAGEPLFSGKVVIEEINVDDLMLNSPRKTNGKINRIILPGPLGAAQAKLNHDIAGIPVLNPESMKSDFNTQKLFAKYKFKTNISGDFIHDKIDATNKKWQENLAKVQDVKTKINNLQQKINELQAKPIQTPLDLKSKIETFNQIQKQWQELQDSINTTAKGYKEEFNQLGDDIGTLKKVAQGDYQALLKMANLPTLDSFNYTEALLGNQILKDSAIFTQLADQIQSSIPIRLDSPPKEEHPRGGQDITFPGRKTYPRLLIKRISISGRGNPDSKLNGYFAKGVVTGVTSEPALTGEPLRATVFGKAPNQAHLDLKAKLDYSKTHYNDQLNLKIGDLPLPDFDLPQSKYFPSTIKTGKTNVDTDFLLRPNYFKLNMKIDVFNMRCMYPASNEQIDLLTGIIRDVISRLDQVAIDYQLESVNRNMTMKLSSNLDQMIASRFNQVIGERFAKFKQEIMDKVNSVLDEKKKELENTRQQYWGQVQSKLNEVQAMVDEQKNKLNLLKGQLDAKKGGLDTQQLKDKLKLPELPKLPGFN